MRCQNNYLVQIPNWYGFIFTITAFMGNYGFNAPIFVLIRIVIPAGLCIIFYWLGHRAGYRKGKLDTHQQPDKNTPA
jgi:hypothetical protein